jgi:hypothetical protein
MTTLQVQTPLPLTDEVVPKKKRQKKSKEKVADVVAVKAAPQPSDYVIALFRLEDGRVLAIGDKDKGDEQLFRSVLDRNASSLFNAFKVDLAEDVAKYISHAHVFYISEILI